MLREGMLSQERGMLDEAAAAFEQALTLSHDCAQAHLALGRVRLAQDRLEEAADSLQLAVLFDAGSAEAHVELAGVLARLDKHEQARAALQSAIALAQPSCGIWAQCARVYKSMQQYGRAADCYERALEGEPRSADLACQLGYVRYLKGDYDAARSAFAGALAESADHVPSLHNLGLLELETGATQQALEHFERAAALNASDATNACIGHALRDLGRLDEACTAYADVLATNPRFGDARINLAYALLMRGDLEAGWKQYELRFEATQTEPRDFGLPQWQGEPLGGQRLLVFAEQGLGDEIMFAACVPDLLRQAPECVLECNTRLAAIFARSFPQAYIHGGEKNDAPNWLRKLPACDFQVPIGSLPRYFRSTASAFDARAPYLKADPSRIAYWRRRIHADARPCIGIAWRGGALRTRQWLRSIPLDQWLPLLQAPGFRFLALQHGDHTGEVRQISEESGIELEDLSDVCADIDELAGLVCALDLVVTVDNTLAHLAGALGRPAWVILPVAPEWRYPRAGGRMPWYPSMRLFHQDAPRQSAGILSQIAAELRAAIAAR
jgi:tetratricopeptide (TPR) repeat protein